LRLHKTTFHQLIERKIAAKIAAKDMILGSPCVTGSTTKELDEPFLLFGNS